MDPHLVSVLAGLGIALALIAFVVRFWPDSSKSKPHGIVIVNTFETAVENPLVQAIVLDFLEVIKARALAMTTDKSLQNLEALAFDIIAAKVKSLASTPKTPTA